MSVMSSENDCCDQTVTEEFTRSFWPNKKRDNQEKRWSGSRQPTKRDTEPERWLEAHVNKGNDLIENEAFPQGQTSKCDNSDQLLMAPPR